MLIVGCVSAQIDDIFIRCICLQLSFDFTVNWIKPTATWSGLPFLLHIQSGVRTSHGKSVTR